MKDKIVLIGPVYPYKGGISHYTSLMYRALEKKYDVKLVSYQRQYPKILFHKEQKDESDQTFQIEGTNFWIDTANPFLILSAARRINRWNPKLVIIQWWHPYFAPCYRILAKCLKKTKILFVCHNIFPHDRFPMDRLLTKMTLRNGDCYIVQSAQDENDLKQVVVNPVYEKTVHPTYNAFRLKGMKKDEARKLIGAGEADKILLFFGFIKEYKGLKHLIQAMPVIRNGTGKTKLLIVGDFGDTKGQYLELIETCNASELIEIHDGYLPNQEIEKYFMACDLVILPYESATQSGIVQIAYAFGKPVVVTRVGGLPEVVKDGETGYVVEPGNPEALARAVIHYYANHMEEKLSEGVKREEYRFSWDRMTETVERLLEQVTGR